MIWVELCILLACILVGARLAKHKTFTIATDVKVYFCDPQSPWQLWRFARLPDGGSSCHF
jgi:hypothetical protein